jgi:hypothetical protein
MMQACHIIQPQRLQAMLDISGKKNAACSAELMHFVKDPVTVSLVPLTRANAET